MRSAVHLCREFVRWTAKSQSRRKSRRFRRRRKWSWRRGSQRRCPASRRPVMRRLTWKQMRYRSVQWSLWWVSSVFSHNACSVLQLPNCCQSWWEGGRGDSAYNNENGYNIENDKLIKLAVGGPGCGRGGQCKHLVDRYIGWVHLRVGDLLRHEFSYGDDPKWSDIANMVHNGELAPSVWNFSADDNVKLLVQWYAGCLIKLTDYDLLLLVSFQQFETEFSTGLHIYSTRVCQALVSCLLYFVKCALFVMYWSVISKHILLSSLLKKFTWWNFS